MLNRECDIQWLKKNSGFPKYSYNNGKLCIYQRLTNLLIDVNP